MVNKLTSRAVMVYQKWLLLLALMAAASSHVYAVAATGLPWEVPLQTLSRSMTGPVALAIVLAGLVAGACAYIFHAEMGRIGTWAIGFTSISALVLGSATLITSLFGAGGALV